jgi:hypothetical protein
LSNIAQENESNRSQCLQISAKTHSIAKKIDFSKEELFELKVSAAFHQA